MSSSSERVQAGASTGISAALPVASVMQCRVKPSPCTATVTPSMGADWRAAKVWMRRVPVFFMEIRSFAGKSMLLPQRIPSGAWACMAMPAANKKAARRRQGRKLIWRCPWQGRRQYFFAGRQGFLPCQCRPAGAGPQRCRPGQRRRWWGKP